MSGDLGPVVQTFTYRNPFRLVLALLPGFSILILLVVLAGDNVKAKIGVGIITIVAVAAYQWLRKRVGTSQIAEIYELGFRFRRARLAWNAISDASHATRGGLDLLVIRQRNSKHFVSIHGHVYGTDITSALVTAMQGHGIKIINVGR